jgi:hypothetical protein
MNSDIFGTFFGLKFPINPGQRVRILALHGHAQSPIFWFGFGGDGSIYLGPGYTKATKFQYLRKGSVPSSSGCFRVNYGEGEVVSDPTELKGVHISFHKSGQVNVAGDKHFVKPLTDLGDQKWLCSMVFQHPSKWPTVDYSSSSSEDKVLDLPLAVVIGENSPLWGLMYVAPVHKLKLVTAKNMFHQCMVTCTCQGMKNIPDMGLHLILGQGPAGPWPPETYILYSKQ